MASIILRIILLLMFLGTVSAAWNKPDFIWVPGIFLGMLALTFVRFNADEKQISTNTLSESEKVAKLKRSPSDWITALLLLFALVSAFLIVGIVGIDKGRFFIGIAIGIVIYLFLVFTWATIHTKIETKRFNKFLKSLPPEQRLKAIDERFGGMLTKLAATPEFKRAEEEFRKRFEGRLKPILDTLETPGPLSFSAQNQLEAKFKELEKELSIKKLKE
jgi:hypothetical protein